MVVGWGLVVEWIVVMGNVGRVVRREFYLVVSGGFGKGLLGVEDGLVGR